jgi:hypothetical protein
VNGISCGGVFSGGALACGRTGDLRDQSRENSKSQGIVSTSFASCKGFNSIIVVCGIIETLDCLEVGTVNDCELSN